MEVNESVNEEGKVIELNPTEFKQVEKEETEAVVVDVGLDVENKNMWQLIERLQALEELSMRPEGQNEQVQMQLQEAMAKVFDAVQGKVDATVSFVENVEALNAGTLAQAEYYETKVQQLRNTIRYRENKLDWLENYIINCIEKLGVAELNGDFKVIKIKKPRQKVELVNEDQIPPEFLITVPATSKIDIKEIGKTLAEGKEVPGAKLVDGTKTVLYGDKPVKKEKTKKSKKGEA